MRTLLALTALAVAITASPAGAEDHKDGKHDMFAKHDTNGDGVVTKGEFMQHAEAKFAEMDADGNGEISQDEAKAKREAMKKKWQEKRKERMEKRKGEDSSSE